VTDARLRRGIAVVLGAVASFLAPAARAEEEMSAWERHRNSVEVRFGIGTPVGALGAVFLRAIAPQVSLGGGIGVGSGPTPASMVHGAAIAQLRPIVGTNNALLLELSVSGGGYLEPDIGLDHGNHAPWGSPFAVFTQVAFGYELRTDGGFGLHVAPGLAWLMNPGNMRCLPDRYDPYCSPHEQGVLPTFEIAVGGAF
jgi:hypothetical protein